MVGMKKKCSFLIEGGVQSSAPCEALLLSGPALSNGVYLVLQLNEILKGSKANIGLGQGSIVSDGPFFNNRVYSNPFLCYGNIKIAHGGMPLIYGNIIQ
jgi:hypothetical protein